MNAERKRNLTINGIGSSGGGDFQDVNIDGVGKVNGDLNCKQFRCNGTITVNGDLQAEAIQINGLSTMNGRLAANKVTIDGRIKVEGHVSAPSLKIHGIGTLRSGLAGEQIELDGSLSIGGDCEAERFQANGKFNIDGLLNAGTVVIKLYHGSNVKEIGGEHIDVRKGHPSMWMQLFSAIIPSFAPKLVTDLIEGDDIYLEHTESAVVRGNRVKIGPGCRIDRVEYKQSFDRHSRSNVKAHLKV